MIGREVEVGPGEARVRDEIAEKGCQRERQSVNKVVLLEKDDIDKLTENQPGVILRWNVFPLVSFSHFHLQLPLPPPRPIPAFFTSLLTLYVQPSPTFQQSDNPFPLTLPPQRPSEAPVIASSP